MGHDAITVVVGENVSAAALQWLRAGAVGDWAWWCSLNESTREAFAVAGDELRIEQAAMTARALLMGPEVVEAPFDDGEALAAAAMAESAQRAAERKAPPNAS